MIDLRKMFITLDNKIVYFNFVTDFAIQKGLGIVDETEISKLQPGTLTVILEDTLELPFDEIFRLSTPEHWPEKLGAYLINYAIIFNKPQIYARRYGDNSTILHIESDIVDILIERSKKYPPISKIKPLINLIHDEGD